MHTDAPLPGVNMGDKLPVFIVSFLPFILAVMFILWCLKANRKAKARNATKAPDAVLVKWIDNAVIEGRLHKDPWVSEYWMPLTQEKKLTWFAERRSYFLELHTQLFTQNDKVPYPTIIAMVERALGSPDSSTAPNQETST
jgi:hypothetical protein